ncbi:hypothetical protein [Bradyrhizobium sp. RDM4]|uniref:hypothetical protein n=1 Tax=Bradyrhizobium sp. RDM4 TaxID=3378765 RepID=UPI0038FC7B3A
MSFERFAGMASAAGFVLIFAITMWTGLWGPLWQNIGGAEILNLFVAIIGWVVTVGIGWRAFVLSQRQIALGREQIAIQQGQIRETQADLAQASFLRINAEVDQLGHDIDKLMTASGYLDKLIERFPNQGRVDGWTKALLNARRVGVDSLSQSAAGAPFGYGARVMTVINRLQRMGDVMFDEITMKSIPMEGAATYWDPHVKEAIEGICLLSSQIKEEVPRRQSQLQARADQRDILGAHARELRSARE